MSHNNETLALRYGIDCSFYQGDLIATGAGDFMLTEGVEGIRQVIARSLITSPGELFWRPNYGIGVEEFLNAPMSAATVSEIKSRIRHSLEDQDDVEEILAVDVSMYDDGRIEIDLTVRLAGMDIDLSTTIGG